MDRFFKLLFILILLFYLHACGDASQNNNNHETTGLKIQSAEEANKGKKVTKKTIEFTMNAFMESMTGAELAKLAWKNTTNDRVRTFAQNILADYNLFYNGLSKIAEDENITLPIVMDKDHQKLYEKLEKKKGTMEFDERFIDLITKNIENNIDLCEHDARKVEDTSIKDFVIKFLPELKRLDQTAKMYKDR
jgi:predicted outer membrane protein